MKKILIILSVMAVSLGASAQKKYAPPRGYHIHHRSHVVITYARPYLYPDYYWYDPFYYPYYNPYYYPYGYYNPGESKLEVKIDEIRSKYQDKIWSARHDKRLSRAKRKETIHQLKHERDMAIDKAKEDYYNAS